MTIEDASKTQLPRSTRPHVVRKELRHHLGPEADHLLNVKNAPMSAEVAL
jgi:hypothetical protein